MTALEDTNPRECLDCGRTDGGCDRIAIEPTNPTTEAREALARVVELDPSSDLHVVIRDNYASALTSHEVELQSALRALLEENERLRGEAREDRAAMIEASNDAEVWRKQMHEFKARAEVAEAKLAALEAQPDWEYGIANYGDLDDVIACPIPGYDGRAWSMGAVQSTYGDKIVRRRKPGPWEPVPDTRSNT